MKPRRAQGLVDDRYHELFRIHCRQCGRRFRPLNETYHYCCEPCAYRALLARREGGTS
jgi:DNA-directed RNA polymerase subunit RPC12/RpoP